MSDEVVADVGQLVEHAGLLGISIVKIAAERFDDVQPSEDFEIEPRYSLVFMLRDDAAGFRVRIETDIELPVGSVSCAVAAEYGLEGLVVRKGSTVALQEFVNNVALMHVLPFTRQAIADVTQRVFNAPLLMPIIQRGAISFELETPATVPD
ncbi:hypothetical protein [Leifsonia naganoensis]|uniref:Preprotein translocase subunit SecB n=1 Tax=Leifsonia naganoensis TaxID=150025 RepID=A0A853DS03_9MICO|nr:hypothetical protein [Leifsonia naganoensis]NYK09374.1 hypothetical protein [Leifsonia naganoensis]